MTLFPVYKNSIIYLFYFKISPAATTGFVLEQSFGHKMKPSFEFVTDAVRERYFHISLFRGRLFEKCKRVGRKFAFQPRSYGSCQSWVKICENLPIGLKELGKQLCSI